MVPLLQINMLPFYHLWNRRWGRGLGTVVCGDGWNGDDLETSCGI